MVQHHDPEDHNQNLCFAMYQFFAQTDKVACKVGVIVDLNRTKPNLPCNFHWSLLGSIRDEPREWKYW
jgi:hypothetical protein